MSYRQMGYQMGVACRRAGRYDQLAAMAADTTEYGDGFRAGWESE